MKHSGRDEFKAGIINNLAKRVNLRCSNPACRKPTSGPHSNPDKSTNNGVAAHITAAAVGGPRYDASLTPQQRASSTNGIWLCQNCSRIIDNDDIRYPISLLEDWKLQAETIADLEAKGESVPEFLRRERPLARPAYSNPDIFIQRQIEYSSFSSKTSEGNSTLWTTLTDLISESQPGKPCRIILQSEAGAGKTTELDFIAYYFATDANALFYPIYISLKNYTDQDVTALLDHYCKNWMGLEESEVLLILDGLDEIKAEKREDFIRKVRMFTDVHASCNLVMSCRANFSNNISTQLQGFSTYTLHEFNDQDIQAYVRKRLPSLVEQFRAFIQENELIKWLRNPFSLTHFVTCYEQDPTNLPRTRIDLLQRVVAFPHLTNDLVRLQLEEERESYRQLVMKLAFAMNLMGVNSLPEGQKVELFPTRTDRDRLKNVSFLVVDEEQIRFKHNILQEYFAASVLVGKTFTQIRTCVTFLPDGEKLKPKWLNTLGILLEMPQLPNALLRDIVRLISEREPEKLLSVEYSHFSQSLRTQVFKSILEQPDRRYSRNLLYDSRLADLADITDNPDVIEYLLELIASQDVWLKNESLYYLRLADPNNLFGYELQIKAALKRVLLQPESGVYEQRAAIVDLLKLNLVDSGLTQLLTEALPNLAHAELRDEVCRYLSQMANVDAYIDFVLEGLTSYQAYRKRETVRLAGLGRGFQLALEQIKSVAGLNKLVTYLTANLSFIKEHTEVFNHFQANTSSFSIFAKHLAKAYKDDTGLYPKVFTLYNLLIERHERMYAQDLASFFQLTHTNRVAFQATLEHEEDRSSFYSLGWLATEEILDEYINDLRTDPVDSNQIWRIIGSLNSTDQRKLADQFREKASLRSGQPFEYDTSWATRENVRQQNDRALLLDQQIFIQKVHDIFDYYQTNKLTEDQVWSYKLDLDESDDTVPVQYLSRWFTPNEKTVNRDESVDYLSDKANWDYYTVGVLVDMLENNRLLSPAHIEKIQNWAIAKVAEADFSTAIVESSTNTWSYRPLERLLAKIYLEFPLSLPSATLLDMISFDDNGLATARVAKDKASLTLSEKIVQEVDNKLVSERILGNLKRGIKVKLVLSNHMALCRKLNIHQATPILHAILTGEYGVSLSEFELLRVLEVYLDLGGILTDLTFIFNEFDPENEFSWTILEQFAASGLFYRRICRLLLQKVEEGSIQGTSFQLMRQLINVGSMEGLRLLVNYVKLTNTLPGNYSQLGDMTKLPPQEASERLLDLLSYSVENQVKGDRFHEALEIILMILKDVALTHESIYAFVVSKLEEIIDRCENPTKHFSLKSNLLFLQKEYYLQKTDYQTIAEIKPVIKEYFN